MAILTAQMPTVSAPITPTQTLVTAADKFLAQPGCTYLIHYENGATAGTATLWVLDGNNPGAVVPPGAQAPAVPTGATKWSDALISASLGANAERDIVLDKSIVQNFMDSSGYVNLKHNGTITTITVAIYGPF
jgi:hypothetical protein